MINQNNFPLNNPDQTPERDSVASDKKNVSKFIVRAVLLLPVPFILGFFSFGMGFGCGLGGGHNFDCRIAAPSLWIGFLVSVISLIIISRGVFSGKSTKLPVVIFICSFAIPMFLLALPNMLSGETKLKYLEGYTVEACAQAKPVVPWGEHFSADQCYYKFDICDKISGGYLKQSCFFDTQGNLKPNKISSVEQCNTIGDHYYILACERNFAAQRKDPKYCETITDQREETAIGLRLSCFDEVAGSEGIDVPSVNKGIEMQAYAINNQKNPLACNTFQSLQKDVCLFWMMEYANNGIMFCDQITTSESFKKDCKIYHKYVTGELR